MTAAEVLAITRYEAILLSEALAERKQLLSDISTLGANLQTVAVRYDDDPADPQAEGARGMLKDAIDRFEALSIAINKTNNATEITFDGKTCSLMEAIAFRESLRVEARHFRAAADHVQSQLRGYSGYRSSRTKDDIKQVAVIPASELRGDADRASETLRRVDSAIQQKNWTTEVIE